MYLGMMNDPGQAVEKEVRAIGQAQYDFVDLTMEGPKATRVDVDKVKGLLQKYGLAVVGHTDPCLPWAYPLESVRQACFDELRRYAETFAALGAKVMNIHPCYAAPPKMKAGLIKANGRALKPLVKMAADHGLTLALENFLAPFDTVRAFTDLFNEAPGLALHLDAGHSNIGKDPTEKFLSRLGEKLAHVHFSDNRGRNDDHMPLGAGNINWHKVVRELRKTGYDQTITLEIFSRDKTLGARYLSTSRDFLRGLWL